VEASKTKILGKKQDTKAVLIMNPSLFRQKINELSYKMTTVSFHIFNTKIALLEREEIDFVYYN
jgi:hypothetical protein